MLIDGTEKDTGDDFPSNGYDKSAYINHVNIST